MKVAVLSESSADEAAIRILIEGILGSKTEAVSPSALRSRGWPAVIRILPNVIKFLHYRTDAEALVVVADSDDSPVHQSTHDQAGGEDARCRLCQLRTVIRVEKAQLRPIPGRASIKTAIGLAVPAIEAWYLCGSLVNEATWARKQKSERIIYTRRSLKKSVYGTERPTIVIEERYAVEAARKLVDDLAALEKLFPNGFGYFAREVRNW
jgi:hypothetical protein